MTKQSRTLARQDQKRLFLALTEMANLRGDPAAFERFLKRWPGFVHVDEGAYQLKRGEKVPHKFGALVERREALRTIWRGDAFTLRNLLLPTDPPEELRGEYFDRNLAPDEPRSGVMWDTQIGLDWQRGQFIYEPRTEFQKALYHLFRQSARAKVCGNRDCLAPYFIADKTIQRYCSDACAQVFQQAWKRKWWAEHGDIWRRSRKKLKRKLGGKR
jgi:hypothetical protein